MQMGYEDLRLGESEDYIGAAEIAQHVARLGDFYTEHYKDADEVLAIVMMQGATFFGADLIRSIRHPGIIFDTIRAKSRDGVESTDEVIWRYMSDHEPEGRDILIIEDILDSGLTLSRITKLLRDGKPASIAVASMFEKPERRLPNTELDVDDLRIGIRIQDEFIVGYGLDWKGRYRNLPFVTKAVEKSPGFFVPKVMYQPAA